MNVKKQTNPAKKEIKLTNPDKLMVGSVTKMEILNYYKKAASYMMPYFEKRNLSLVACPKGLEQGCYFRKNLNSGIGSESSEKQPIIFTKPEDIFEAVQNNTVEFHGFGSIHGKGGKTVNNDEAADGKPDVMVFDLDPGEGVGQAAVHQGVRDLKSILDELNLKSFLKTSGNKGYHIYIPIKPMKDWERFIDFSRAVAELMQTKWPNKYTSNVRLEHRNGKIFVDWLRNGRGATCVLPFSIRAKPGAKVSMPIYWHELARIAPDSISIEKALARIKNYPESDPWADFFEVQKLQGIG